MESISSWFQDWSDACEYAKECAPDLASLGFSEPYTALAGVAAVCFLVWRRNERVGARSRSSDSVATTAHGDLGAALEQALSVAPAPEKKAA